MLYNTFSDKILYICEKLTIMTPKQLFQLFILVLILALFATVSIQYSTIKEKNDENARISQNQTVLNDQIKTFKSKDSLNVSEIAALTYTNAEFKRFNSETVQAIKSMGLSLKNVQNTLNSYIQTIDSLKGKTEIKLIGKDTAYCFSQKTKFSEISGCVTRYNAEVVSKSWRSLTAIISTDYSKRFLFIKYGKKITKVDIKSDNPNDSIKSVEFVVVKN